jgi:hypothetical protein
VLRDKDIKAGLATFPLAWRAGRYRRSEKPYDLLKELNTIIGKLEPVKSS